MGKVFRLKRIFREDSKSIIVPLDHGVTYGPIRGIQDVRETVKKLEPLADALLFHKGVARYVVSNLSGRCGVIIHLSGSLLVSPSHDAKVLVGTVEEAVSLGADGISIHINIGNEWDRDMLRDLGSISRKAERWGIPLLAMIYPRGSHIKDPADPGLIAHAARLGAELGADVIKVPYTGSPESFRKVVEGTFVPVVMAGGPRAKSERDFLTMVRCAMDAGASGLSVGRNVFQHEHPEKMLKALSMIVHGGAEVDEALEVLK